MTHPTRCHVYGPVPSRRLGRSLGVDLVPFKTCPYDCIYCQLGRTTHRTLTLAEYVPVDEVVQELSERLANAPLPDFIGLAGAGEPTLHSGLGRLISTIKTRTRVPVAVLTNGALLYRPEVRANLADADLVLPSLDAGDPESFVRINRPHPELSFERMIGGLSQFSREYRGRIWLEVLLVGQDTDRPAHVERIATLVKHMRVERVQLNTVSRPPADGSARAVRSDQLRELTQLFSCPCESIAETCQSRAPSQSEPTDVEQQIVALLSRRPCTLEGVATGLGLAPNLILKHLDPLVASETVRVTSSNGTVFYSSLRLHP